MFSLISKLRPNQRCIQMAINFTTKYLKREITSDQKSLDFRNNKISECLKYYPLMANNGLSMDQIYGKIDPTLDDINKSYILLNGLQINPILVPNLTYFQIEDKLKRNERIDSESDGKPTKELPASGTRVGMYLDYVRKRNPRSYSHLTVIRRHKMSKHKRRKWRRKNLAFLMKKYLRRNIKTEKLFRVELLAQIKEAEDFNAEEYVSNILKTIDNMPKEETNEERQKWISDQIRKNRRETNFIEPKFED